MRKQIDQILGNSLRCVLPSFWWKKLFSMLLDRVESAKSDASSARQLAILAGNASGGKQDKLVSGSNIKTVNGQSLLGSGNLNIDAEEIEKYSTEDELKANVHASGGNIAAVVDTNMIEKLFSECYQPTSSEINANKYNTKFTKVDGIAVNSDFDPSLIPANYSTLSVLLYSDGASKGYYADYPSYLKIQIDSDRKLYCWEYSGNGGTGHRIGYGEYYEDVMSRVNKMLREGNFRYSYTEVWYMADVNDTGYIGYYSYGSTFPSDAFALIDSAFTMQYAETVNADVYIKSAEWKRLMKEGEGGSSVVDSELSDVSTNPVQNKVITEALNNKVDKVEGKQLSMEDFTTLLKEKLEGLSNYDDSEIVATFNQLRSDFNTLVGGNVSVAINSFNEIIAFLEGVEDSQSLDNIIASIEQQIAAKQNTISDLETIREGAAKGATALQSYTEQYQGTVTGVKINGTTKNPSNGIVDLGTVITDISGKADKDKYNNYSTDEVRIGTWINGKSIYRKTIVYTCDDLNKTKFWAYYPADTTGTEISQLNIDAYINISGVTFCANQAITTGAWQPVPRVCPDANEAYNIGFGDLKPTRVGVLFGNKYLSATIYLTIEYTKTTD